MELGKLLEDYRWSFNDEANLEKLLPYLEAKRGDFVKKYYLYIERFEDSKKFLKDEQTVERHKQMIGEWFIRLAEGLHDESYLRGLFKIGLAHLRIGLPPHYINASFTFIREYLTDIIHSNWERGPERDAIRRSVNRILDINIDVIAMSYREEELRDFLSSTKFNRRLINWASGFSVLMDSFLTMFLVILAILVGGYSLYEVFLVIQNPVEVSKKVLAILGNLLILWAISELLEENIKHLRGGKFAIKIFVAVGLAAIVREILIVSLSHKYDALGFMTFTLLALGIVYYLMARSETKYNDSNSPKGIG